MSITPTASPPLGAGLDDAFASIVARLSRQSVDKHFSAYEDVPWDDPDYAIDPDDQRWQLWSSDALGHTSWYRSQEPQLRSRIALHRIAACMRVGWEFENVLQRGLLAYAMRLPNGAPEFRYIHHEIVEESQHTMMFQEFVNRTGLPVRGMRDVDRVGGERLVLPMGRVDPPLFFLFVLGGEDPVDHLQRQQLKSGVPHPVLERIMRIHVTEEARHISFARNYLKTEVPKLPAPRRHALSVAAPVLFGVMTRMMCDPPPQLSREYGIPRSVMREAKRSRVHRGVLAQCGSKPRKMCQELGLVTRETARLWDRFGLTLESARLPAGAVPSRAASTA
ncbi:MAG: AurF N-oxygenase family protein [Acidimicrobiales bacterium]